MMKMKFYCGHDQLPCHSPLRKILLVVLSTKNGLKSNYNLKAKSTFSAFIGDKKFGMGIGFDLVEPSINKYYEISIN